MHLPFRLTRNWVKLAAGLAAVTAMTIPAVALSVPAVASPQLPSPAYNCVGVGRDSGCGYIITVTGNGTASVSGKLQPPIDAEGDDTLIGIVNDSDALVTSIALSGTNIFAFDGDGICSGDYTWTPSSAGAYCSSLPTYSKTKHPQVSDPYDYEGPNNTFAVTSHNAGTVDFTTPLIPAQATFFSIEEPSFKAGTVGLAPDIAVTASPVTAIEGISSGPVTVATFTDGAGGPSPDSSPTTDFSANISWGDGATSTGIISGGSGSPYVVTGTHTYTEEAGYATSVTITDKLISLNTGTSTSTATVADAPLTAGTLTLGGSPVEGVTDASASFAFTDANTYATTADYTATINWGDGTAPATGTVAATATPGAFNVTGNHLYTEEGSYTVTVTVVDDGGSTTSQTGSITVADAPLMAGTLSLGSPVENVTPSDLTFTFTDANPYATVADFTTGNGSTLITWGDGATAAGTVTESESGGVFTVSASHLYAEEGPYSVTVVVTDDGGSTAMATGTAEVADAPLTAGTLTLSGNPVEGGTPAMASFGFTDANTAATTADYTATIVWGDGNTTNDATVSATATPGAFTVSGSHVYHEYGTYPVSVSVADDGGSATSSATVPVTVADALLSALPNPTIPDATTNGSFQVPVAAFADANPFGTASEFTATISWGDGYSSIGSVTETGSSATASDWEVTGSHQYSSNGTYQVSTTVEDSGGKSVMLTNSVTDYDAVISCSSSPCSGTASNSLQSTSASTSSTTGTILLDLNNTPSVGAFSCNDPWRHAPQYSTILDSGLNANGTIDLTISFANNAAAGAWWVPFAVCYDSPGVDFTSLTGQSVTLGLLPLCPVPRKGQTITGPCVQSIYYSTIIPLPSEAGTVTEQLILPPNDPFSH